MSKISALRSILATLCSLILSGFLVACGGGGEETDTRPFANVTEVAQAFAAAPNPPLSQIDYQRGMQSTNPDVVITRKLALYPMCCNVVMIDYQGKRIFEAEEYRENYIYEGIITKHHLIWAFMVSGRFTVVDRYFVDGEDVMQSYLVQHYRRFISGVKEFDGQWILFEFYDFTDPPYSATHQAATYYVAYNPSTKELVDYGQYLSYRP